MAERPCPTDENDYQIVIAGSCEEIDALDPNDYDVVSVVGCEEIDTLDPNDYETVTVTAPAVEGHSDCICCECDCCRCNGYWTQMVVTISGFGGSSKCLDLNAVHTMNNVAGGCLWSIGGPPPP